MLARAAPFLPTFSPLVPLAEELGLPLMPATLDRLRPAGRSPFHAASKWPSGACTRRSSPSWAWTCLAWCP
eukprot:5800426-Pyramimonas_sp.AAC.1